MALDMISFGQGDIDNVLKTESSSEIDKVAFGAIQLNVSGKVLQYNLAEGEGSGRDPAATIGKNVFSDVAPVHPTTFL